jgi:riboflavin transporter FmnP
MDSKKIAFISIMAALGNVLFLLSFYAGPITPGVAFDFSLTTTFIAALYGGPLIGLITGLFVGVFPGIYFGPLGHGSWLGLIGLPIGKALTGLTSGLLASKLNLHEKTHRSLLTIPIVLFSYVPECIFTIFYFVSLMPYFIGGGGIGTLVFVIPKAWIEILVISVLMAALVGNQGFVNFVIKFLTVRKST